MARPTEQHINHEHEPGRYHWCIPALGGCTQVSDIPVRHFCEVEASGKIRAIYTVRFSWALEVEGAPHPAAGLPPGCDCHEMPDLEDHLRALGVTKEQLIDHYLHDPVRGIFIPDPTRPITGGGGG